MEVNLLEKNRNVFKIDYIINNMNKKVCINIIIEKEKQDSNVVFVASSPNINVFAEGENIDEVRSKFIEGVKHHFETFPEERELLIKKEKCERPLIQRIFL